jgi:tRNA threonylcarbamoyladenosine biosynthesis protein TsaB
LSEDGAVLFSKEDHEGPQHAVTLGVFVDEVLSMADSHAKPIDAVAVSCGPGSYTGLRIGVSMAKGICYGRNIPLIALPTLKVLSVPVLLMDELPEDALLCPMIDARRMEVYAAIYDRALNEVKSVGADIVDADSYKEYLDKQPVYFFGNGAAKCLDTLTDALYVTVSPSARGIVRLAEEAFKRGAFEDIAYFEPFYLKEFLVIPSKKKLL